MRDEALIHFHYGRKISAGLHIGDRGGEAPRMIEKASPYLDPRDPGRCVVGFCAANAPDVVDVTAPPPLGWQDWTFARWDDWFGRINGVFLVDLERLRVVQWPMYRVSQVTVPCDLSRMPGRLVALDDLKADNDMPKGPGVADLLRDMDGRGGEGI